MVLRVGIDVPRVAGSCVSRNIGTPGLPAILMAQPGPGLRATVHDPDRVGRPAVGKATPRLAAAARPLARSLRFSREAAS